MGARGAHCAKVIETWVSYIEHVKRARLKEML